MRVTDEVFAACERFNAPVSRTDLWLSAAAAAAKAIISSNECETMTEAEKRKPICEGGHYNTPVLLGTHTVRHTCSCNYAHV